MLYQFGPAPRGGCSPSPTTTSSIRRRRPAAGRSPAGCRGAAGQRRVPRPDERGTGAGDRRRQRRGRGAGIAGRGRHVRRDAVPGGRGRGGDQRESARADPRVVYVAMFAADQSPRLARTNDGGAHWTVSDLGAGIGAGVARIIAVDPDDPDTVLLRWASVNGGEAIAVTRDGGATAARRSRFPTTSPPSRECPTARWLMSAVVAVSPAQKSAPVRLPRRGASFQRNDAVPNCSRWPSGVAFCTRRRTTSATATRSARPATRARPGSRSFASTRSDRSWPACARTRSARRAAKRSPATASGPPA